MSRSVLLLGQRGMLGSDLLDELLRRSWQTQGLDLPEFDITDPAASAQIAAGQFGRLDWVVNCAAYTAVDRAEEDADSAVKVNSLGPGYVAQACAMSGVRMLHLSTDFVFDGTKREPYVETDPPNPQGVYARSKLDGETAVRSSGCGAIVARTAWLYGPQGPSFPRTIIRTWRAGKTLHVVADQVGNPTYTADLARVLVDLLEVAPEPGIYHVAGPETMSWHRLAGLALDAYRRHARLEELPIEVRPIRTEDWPTPAKRPAFSALSFEKTSSLGIAPMRPVLKALSEFVQRLPEDV